MTPARTVLAVCAASILALVPLAHAANAPGKISGGARYTLPQWFKPSFFIFKEDAEEARKQAKHVMVFVHLDECPYCERVLRENFVSGENQQFMRKHFDVIALNIRGALEVVWTDGVTYTERTLAQHLKIFATPTLVFLDPQGKPMLQLPGYRDPRALRLALEYVQSQSYRDRTFTSYVAARDKRQVYVLRDHPRFSPRSSFKGYKKPLAVVFEDRQCADCATFHDKVLGRPDVLAEMAKLEFVRLDTDSTQPIIDLDGNTTTAAQWASKLDLSYRPALALFDQGRTIFRMDGRLYHFHFKEALRYVSGGHYKRYPSISAYNAARRAELLKSGVDIDYAE